MLAEFGWEYLQAVHWDKGLGHIAGNVNGKTIRRFPVVNEMVVFYTRRLEFPTPDGVVPARRWLLDEWLRSGLPRRRANDACGVRDAATRKYFDQGRLWYPPPAGGRLPSCAPNGAPLPGQSAAVAAPGVRMTDDDLAAWERLAAYVRYRDACAEWWTYGLRDSCVGGMDVVVAARRDAMEAGCSQAELCGACDWGEDLGQRTLAAL